MSTVAASGTVGATDLSNDSQVATCYGDRMRFWIVLSRILLVVAVFYGSTPQPSMAGARTMALHASMMSMSPAEMDGGKAKAAAGYCMQHCLALLAILPVLAAPLRDISPAVRLKPALGRVPLSRGPTPSGPPPKAVAG